MYLPIRGTESDWAGRVSATSSKKTVRASSTVTLSDICNMRISLKTKLIKGSVIQHL